MPSNPDDQIRARDIDRVAVLARLDDALMDGQLDHTEHARRAAATRGAITLRDLGELTADLQHGDPTPVPAARQPLRRRKGVVVGSAVVAVSAAVGIALVAVVPDGGAPSPRSSVVAPAMVAGDMFTATGIRDVVTAVRARFHTTTVEGIHLYRDHAVLFVVDPASPVGSTHYEYSPGGEFHSPEYYSGLAVSTSNAPVDLARIDADRVAALIASAPGRLGLTAANTAREDFRVTVGGDDGGEIWMGVNDIGIDSHLVSHLDGTIKGVDRCGWGC